MTARAGLLRRLAAGLLLVGALAGAGLHHHEDLAGVAGAPSERVLSSHDPLSRATHWHSAVRVKDDPCLACHGQRAAGLSPEAHDLVVVADVLLHGIDVAVAPVTAALASHGSRAPPALL